MQLFDELKKKLTADVENATVVQSGDLISNRAVACLERAPLRASDAVHVATALEHSPALFLSGDHQQCAAARAMGLNVEEITP